MDIEYLSLFWEASRSFYFEDKYSQVVQKDRSKQKIKDFIY